MTADRTAAPGRLEVRADLHLSVDGTDVRVVGDGSQLRVETEHPLALLRQARALGAATPLGRGAVARIADALDEQGLTVVAPGPRGVSIRLGADASSRMSGRLTGTPNVQVSGGSLLPSAAAAVGVGIALWWVRRHLR